MRISHLSDHDGRYVVASDTPDGRSTWGECWGKSAEFDARAMGASDRLGDARIMAENLHNPVILDRETGRAVRYIR